MTGGEFFIAATDKETARQSLRKSLGGSYPYVHDTWRNAGTLEELLKDWRFEVENDVETGDITDLHFTGENAGEEEDLLQALAPFVREGSHLYFVGDDGDSFGYFFEAGRCEYREARVSF